MADEQLHFLAQLHRGGAMVFVMGIPTRIVMITGLLSGKKCKKVCELERGHLEIADLAID